MEKKLSCIDIASLKMSKNVYSRLVYCKISDNIAVDSESQLLLPRAGRGLMLGITNPREIFFLFGHFLKLNRRIYFMHF